MFVWVLQGKAKDPKEIGRQVGRWTSDFGATAGLLGATGGVTDDSRFLLFVRWESEAAGNELLMRPEHQEWYEEFERSFDGDIVFFETDDVTSLLAGGSDAAGFVQAMKVSGVDRRRIEEADKEFDKIASEMRPDLIGGLRVWSNADSFVEFNYFTSEQDARVGEQQAPPPEMMEGFAEFMAMMSDAEFFDFTEPFLHTP
jgi:hypothetical protein